MRSYSILFYLYLVRIVQQNEVPKNSTGGRPKPVCHHKATVLMRRMSTLDCLHGFIMYVPKMPIFTIVLPSILCAIPVGSMKTEISF